MHLAIKMHPFSIFIQRLTGRANKETRAASPRRSYISNATGLPMEYTKITTPETAMTITEYYKSVKLISERIAIIPLLMFQIISTTGDIQRHARPTRQQVYDHPLLKLLNKPNQWTTYFNLIRTWINGYLNWGNGYVLIDTDESGNITGLYNRHPTEVIPFEYYPNGPEGICEIWYKDYRTDTEYPKDRVWHLADVSDNEILGVSKIVRHAFTIGKSKAALNLVNTLFTDGAKIRYAIEYPLEAGKVDGNKVDDIHEYWKKAYGGMNKENVPGVIGGGGKVKQLTADMPLGDAQYIEAENLTASQIRDIFSIPHTADYKSREDYMDALYDFALAPIMQMMIEQISSSVLMDGQEDTYLRFDRHSHANLNTLSKYLTDMVRGSIMDINEARDIVDLPPVSGGDQIMVQANNLIALNNLELYTEAQIENLLKGGNLNTKQEDNV
jgi:HK97 family phage portal protein